MNVIVEGQTEEAFVNDVLYTPLRRRAVYLRPILVPTKRGARSRSRRGGMGSFAAARRIIERKVRGDTTAFTTTMFDYYGLPGDFPGLGDDDLPPPVSLDKRIAFLEDRLAGVVDGVRRFRPYLQVHEFEALLFSDVQALDEAVRLQSPRLQSPYEQSRVKRLENVLSDFGGRPEAINDGTETAPTKRLRDMYPGYDKVLFGSLVAEAIGLDATRAACLHFDAWVQWLEGLASLAA